MWVPWFNIVIIIITPLSDWHDRRLRLRLTSLGTMSCNPGSTHCCGSTPEASNAPLKKSIGRSEKTTSATSYNLGQQRATVAALRAETSGQQRADTLWLDNL